MSSFPFGALGRLRTEGHRSVSNTPSVMANATAKTAVIMSLIAFASRAAPGGNGTNVVHTNTLAAAGQQPLRHLSLEQLAQVTRQHPRDRGDVDAKVHAGVGHGRARSSSRAGKMRCVSSSTSRATELPL